MVLNSLSGELFHASWECVAKHGKMMEIGKRDMIEHGRLDLSRFQGNRTLYGIDVGDLWQNTPDRLMRCVSIYSLGFFFTIFMLHLILTCTFDQTRVDHYQHDQCWKAGSHPPYPFVLYERRV